MESIYTLIGAGVGCAITFLSTFISAQYSKSNEIKKFALSLLIEKKSIIEKLLDQCCQFEYSGDIDLYTPHSSDRYSLFLSKSLIALGG